MPADPGHPTPDVLALERFRTILVDAIEKAGYNAYQMGVDSDPDEVAGYVYGSFPSAQFVHDVNAAGVPVRRLVVHGEWEVDPNPSIRMIGLRRKGAAPGPGSAFYDHRLEAAAAVLGPSLTSPADPHRSDTEPIPWAFHHPFVPVRYKGQAEEDCGHFTQINSHEVVRCGAPESAAMHHGPHFPDRAEAGYTSDAEKLQAVRDWLATYPPVLGDTVGDPETTIVEFLRRITGPAPAHTEGCFLARPHDGMECVAFAGAGTGTQDVETHLFVPVSYKGQIERGCGHLTMISGHEGRMCNKGVHDAIHSA